MYMCGVSIYFPPLIILPAPTIFLLHFHFLLSLQSLCSLLCSISPLVPTHLTWHAPLVSLPRKLSTKEILLNICPSGPYYAMNLDQSIPLSSINQAYNALSPSPLPIPPSLSASSPSSSSSSTSSPSASPSPAKLSSS